MSTNISKRRKQLAGIINRPAKLTIGRIARMSLAQGMTNEQALRAVRKHFPEAETTPACIAWYKSKMKAMGELPKARKHPRRRVA